MQKSDEAQLEACFARLGLILFFTHSFELFFLDLGVDVIHRLYVLALLHALEIIVGYLDNERREDNDTDKVGYHHKAVEGVGDIPRKRGGKDRSEDNGANVDDTEHEGGLCAEEVFPSL